MNDFTKEELENLREACNFFPRDSFYHGEHVTDLRDKLRSMIDNYCEHEWENTCCACNFDRIYCHKCEKDMGNLKARYERMEND